MKEQHKYTTNFTTLDNNIFKFDMSIEARGLYWFMMSKPNEWKFTIEGMAKQIKATEAKTRKMVNELMSLHLVTRKYEYNKKGHRQSIYTIYDSYTMKKPVSLVEEKYGKPNLEKPICDNPNLLNPTLRNHKDIIIKESSNNVESLLHSNLNSNIESEEIKEFIKKEKINKKEKNQKSKVEICLDYWHSLNATNPNIVPLQYWEEWVRYRVKKGKIEAESINRQLRKSTSFLVSDVIEAIDNSITNGYIGLFFKASNNQKTTIEQTIQKEKEPMLEYKGKAMKVYQAKQKVFQYIHDDVSSKSSDRMRNYILGFLKKNHPDFCSKHKNDDELYNKYLDTRNSEAMRIAEWARHEESKNNPVKAKYSKFLELKDDDFKNAVCQGELDEIFA